MNQIIYLSGGCFWGMEKYFSCIPGVVETTVGYANGREAMRSDRGAEAEAVGAAEAVRVAYAQAICYHLRVKMSTKKPMRKAGDFSGES